MEGESSNRKRGRGRKKIPMRKIANKNSLFATFTKRYKGVFKNASELSIESNINVGIIIYSPTGKPYSFMAPTLGTVAKYSNIKSNQDDMARYLDACNKSQIGPLCRQVEQLEAIKEASVQRGLQLMAEANMVIGPDNCWDKPVKDLSYEEAKNMEASLATALFHLKNRAILMTILNSRFGF